MQSLALKYRPITFEKVIGQYVVSRFLSNLIKRGQIGKNIILYGPWGSGKTSLSRIYARALNCDNPTLEGSPCNVCEKCKLFHEEQYTDYIEIDGATQGGKDKIKDLVEMSQSEPYLGKYRVICLDEAHNLSKQAWDTLLKLIEEPPPYLVFLFTTTEYGKVPETIQSRCQDFEVSVLDQRTSIQCLTHICEIESFRFEERALEIISYFSRGHFRDLIKNLEKVYYFGDIALDNVLTVFSFNYAENVVGVFNRLFGGGDISEILKGLNEWNMAPDAIFNTLKSFILALYCNNYKDMNLNIDRVGFISEESMTGVYSKLLNIANTSGLDMGVLFDKLFTMFDRRSTLSVVELQTYMVRLYNYIYLYNLDSKGKNLEKINIKQSVMKENIKQEGRKFIESYQRPEVSPVSESAEGKIYPHSLINLGFSSNKKSEINMVFK